MDHTKLTSHSHVPRCQGHAQDILLPLIKAFPLNNVVWDRASVGSKLLTHHRKTRPKRSIYRTMASMGTKQDTHGTAENGKHVDQATRAGIEDRRQDPPYPPVSVNSTTTDISRATPYPWALTCPCLCRPHHARRTPFGSLIPPPHMPQKRQEPH
ncbi:hypothetical protein V6N13_122302 [Hibiscus sabdariffa]|uniref:Uncharacterized protein n=1 Tax=Hibiscus sabdariffa TaxID=183260 RepID=A0ABR2NJX9_9ROSI